MNRQKNAFNLSLYLKEKRDVINAFLEKILVQCNMGKELTQAMNHSVMAGGKRLRPVLAMAAAEACGKDPAYALPGACAIEMIHTYSLIHDDLPAMDDDDLRRGKPTCHKQFSEATAILAGDGLLTHSFWILSRPELFFETFPEKKILLDIIAIISDAAGVNGMVEGQMMDMQSELMPDNCHKADPVSTGTHPAKRHKTDETTYDLLHVNSLEYLKKMHLMKTGKMIMASVAAGAVSIGAGKRELDALMIYAEKTGLAFQVTDDILNIEGDPEIMGKAKGSDAANHKLTFPGLIGLEESKKYAQKLVNDAVNALEIFKENGLPLKAIAQYILKRQK